jgi:hypothetical protein
MHLQKISIDSCGFRKALNLRHNCRLKMDLDLMGCYKTGYNGYLVNAILNILLCLLQGQYVFLLRPNQSIIYRKVKKYFLQ